MKRHYIFWKAHLNVNTNQGKEPHIIATLPFSDTPVNASALKSLDIKLQHVCEYKRTV